MVPVPPGAQPHNPRQTPKKIPALLDPNFSSYVTPGIIKLIYGLVMVAALLLIPIGFVVSVLTGDGAAISAGLVAVVFLLFLRIGLELTMVIFDMASDLRAVRAAMESGPPPSGPSQAPAWPSAPPPPGAPSSASPGTAPPEGPAPWSG